MYSVILIFSVVSNFYQYLQSDFSTNTDKWVYNLENNYDVIVYTCTVNLLVVHVYMGSVFVHSVVVGEGRVQIL